jgi:hypothetical protein
MAWAIIPAVGMCQPGGFGTLAEVIALYLSGAMPS